MAKKSGQMAIFENKSGHENRQKIYIICIFYSIVIKNAQKSGQMAMTLFLGVKASFQV